MIARGTRIGLEIIAAVVAIAVILTGVLFWRLSQGPVELDFLTPRLEAALSSASDDFAVEVGGTVLAWEGWPETVALRITDVAVRGSAGEVARLPAVDLKLSFPALASGTIAPTEFLARGARLSVIRGPKGFRFSSRPAAADNGDAAANARDVSDILPDILDALMAAPAPERRLSYLERVRIAEARLSVRDEVLGAVWTAPSANIVLRREPHGLTGSADLNLWVGEDTVTAEAAVRYERNDRRIRLLASVRDLRPASLAASVPRLAVARGVTVPLSGTVATTFDLSGRIGDTVANLAGDHGEIAWPDLLPEPLPVRSLRADVRLNRASDTLRVETFEVAFADGEDAGPTIRAQATAHDLGTGPRVEGRVGMQALPLDSLPAYWPRGVGGNARSWVTENIRAGMAEQAETTFALELPDGDFDDLRLLDIDGAITYSGLDVHYLRPMPPVTQVHGTASFDAHTFSLDVAGGSLDRLRVPRAHIDITGLSDSDQFIDIDLDVQGPLRDALVTLDRPRLDLIAELGIDPAQTDGHADVDARFAFPLLADLNMDGVEVRADARLREVRAEAFLFDQDARAGAFDLTVDKTGMHLKGPVELGGIGLELSWRENFAADADYRSELQARIARMSATDRARLGLDTRPFLDGPISANLVTRQDAAGSGFVKATLNLQDASLLLPVFDWRKPVSEAGELQFDLRLEQGRPAALRRFGVNAGGASVPALRAHGRAELAAADAGLTSITLDTFTLAGTRLNKLKVEHTDMGWIADLDGGVFDAAPFMARMEDGKSGDAGPAAQADPTGGTAAGPAIEVRKASLSRIRFAEGRHLDDVALSGRRGADGRWRRLHVEASVPGRFSAAASGTPQPPADGDGAAPSRLFFHYAPRPDGLRALKMTASDTGAALRALDLLDTLQGGTLNIEGLSRGPDPASAIDARVKLRDFRVVKAPVLAKMLTIASLTGITDLMQGDGIRFERFSGDVVYDDGALSTEFVHAYGPALGITAEGKVDLERDSVDLRGTIVPAASVNRVLGKIPVLGQILTGGEGEGLFAATYKLSGSPHNPKISVNPLAALAPGFLRNLFGLGGGDSDSKARPSAVPKGQGR